MVPAAMAPNLACRDPRQRPWKRLVAVLAVVLVKARGAHGQSLATPDGASPVLPMAVPCPSDARQAFEEALAAFSSGDFARATECFEASYRAAPRQVTRYNLGRSYESAGRYGLAIETYEAFARETSDASARDEVLRRIAVMQSQTVPVTFVSHPPGAALRVDDDTTAPARTPATLPLRPHAYQLSLQGYQPEARTLVVSPEDHLHPQVVSLDLSSLPAPVPRPSETVFDRILNRRQRVVNLRLAALAGVAWPGAQFVPAVGFEATAFWRRSLAAQFHFLQMETDGSPRMVTGEIGLVFVLDDLDLGIFAHAGAVLDCSAACRPPANSPMGYVIPGTQFLGGFTVRADVVLLPRVGVGLFGRFSWRDLNITDSASLLSSLGISISFLL